MPSPFGSSNESAKQPNILNVENSELECQYCFHVTYAGEYNRKEKTLYWDCDRCNRSNIVRDMEL